MSHYTLVYILVNRVVEIRLKNLANPNFHYIFFAMNLPAASRRVSPRRGRASGAKIPKRNRASLARLEIIRLRRRVRHSLRANGERSEHSLAASSPRQAAGYSRATKINYCIYCVPSKGTQAHFEPKARKQQAKRATLSLPCQIFFPSLYPSLQY